MTARTRDGVKGSSQRLSAWQLAGLGHGGVLLLEAVAESLLALEVLIDATHNAALLSRGERLACEVVDAVIEAALDEVGVHLRGERSDGGCPA